MERDSIGQEHMPQLDSDQENRTVSGFEGIVPGNSQHSPRRL